MSKDKDKIQKFFDKRRIIGVVFLVVAVTTAILTMYTYRGLQTFFETVSIASDILALYLILVSADTEKRAKVKLEKFIMAVTRLIIKVAKKIVEKLSFKSAGRGYGARMAKGYVDVNTRIQNEKAVKQRKKRKKYKDMDNIEKIRFLYEKKVTVSIRKGAKIEESMTPNEAGDVMIEKKHMSMEGKELIDVYNSARYNDRAVITDGMVEDVKKV